MKKFILPLFVALNPLISNAYSKTVLDCLAPRDQIEADVCQAAQATSCEKAALNAVKSFRQIMTGDKVILKDVKAIEEDAQYEVGFALVNETSGLILEVKYLDQVYVSAGPGDACAVDSIRLK